MNLPSPYMVERFNVIQGRGNIRLEAWFDSERAPDRSWDVRPADWDFPGGYVDPRPLGLTRRIRQAAPDVYFSLYENPSFAAGVLAARATGARTVLRVLKTFEAWRQRSLPREAAKHILFRMASAIHTTGPEGEAYARRYGARRIIKFHEPIDVPRFQAGASQARRDGGLRSGLGLTGCVFLYVGRLWKPKGLDYLLHAFARLKAKNIDASLLIVGDGTDQAYYRQRAAAIPGVVMVDFVQQPDLPRYYGLSDVFVFPTLGDPYGHVVHEAMASSMPVISTANAGDIHERVIEGETGFVVPAANSDALFERMKTLALNPGLREQMAANGFELVKGRTIEWWAGEFENAVYALLELPELAIPSAAVRSRETGEAA